MYKVSYGHGEHKENYGLQMTVLIYFFILFFFYAESIDLLFLFEKWRLLLQKCKVLFSGKRNLWNYMIYLNEIPACGAF